MNFAIALGNGDLTKRIDIKIKDGIGKLSLALNKAVENTRNLIAAITLGSQNIDH
ncbi:hypothetical protein ACJDU8_20670 [Clostridium sp. WILCCON 0269]|uniref:HAMP domain-containing protein n=1 Tax=Candidatus Clostridium eludens TaxID=3381663 RepID=A0ABW8SPG1_9CLOT